MSRHVWPGTLAVCCCLMIGTPAFGETIGESMRLFLEASRGERVGGGNCEDMAIEALRVSNGEFSPTDLGADSPGTGDKVWGTLVTVISCSNGIWSDSSPANVCRPGDVIQYGSAEFGEVRYPARFTAVVATTELSRNRPNRVYQQNFNNDRVVRLASLDVTQLTSGWIRIYRPVGRKDDMDTWKVTLVNSLGSQQTVQLMVDTTIVATVTLSAVNTIDSYQVFHVATDGTVPCLVLSNNESLFLTTGKGTQIDADSGSAVITQLRR